MLLSMDWTEPLEELILNSKLSEKFPVSGSNFARYKGTYMYIHYGMHQQILGLLWGSTVVLHRHCSDQ